jgi:hypothetical protein
LTRLKVVSVLAVAFVLTAFGASSAQAWAGVDISVTVNCDTGKVVVHGQDNDSHDLAHASPSTLTFTDSSGKDVMGLKGVSFAVTHGSDAIATVDVAKFKDATGPFKVHLDADSSVESKEFSTSSCKPPAPTCATKALEISGTLSDKSIVWTIHNPNGVDVNFGWFLKEQSSQHGTGSVTAGHDTTVTTTKISGTNTLKLVPTAGARVCEAIEKAFAAATPTPTPTSTPEATATPTATATAQPTSTAQPTQTAVPSPPETGQGSTGGGGDNSFVLVLLATVLGTVVIGGTTLALSRKGS